jgi:hypothetical protein
MLRSSPALSVARAPTIAEAFERVRTCGCFGLPRRKCDRCAAGRQGDAIFVACSLACLRRHLKTAHQVTQSTIERIADRQKLANQLTRNYRERYADHRRHLMALLASVGGGREIAILGAGNCTDLDLEQLARDFSRIHLFDLDGEALERARESFAAPARGRVMTHSAFDLSGLLGRLDEWGERFPDVSGVQRAAAEAIHALRRRIRQRFHVVLSDCILSQLLVPYRQHWLLPDPTWNLLSETITGIHLATVAGSVAEGGHGIIAFDVIDSSMAPELRGMSADDAAALEEVVCEHSARGSIVHPSEMVQRLSASALAPFIELPRLTRPWLWNTGDTQLVYGLSFDRR